MVSDPPSWWRQPCSLHCQDLDTYTSRYSHLKSRGFLAVSSLPSFPGSVSHHSLCWFPGLTATCLREDNYGLDVSLMGFLVKWLLVRSLLYSFPHHLSTSNQLKWNIYLASYRCTAAKLIQAQFWNDTNFQLDRTTNIFILM